jgi:S-adenosylmethionine-diacylglycerol 3-amino-3-carboxypropyl transferase
VNVQPGGVCLSIASGGDNTLALLSKSPARVIAVDTNPAQLACLELRVAAYRELTHPELLELMGSVPSDRRGVLYERCRPRLSCTARMVWDARRGAVERSGAGSAGKFERYLHLFRRLVLPVVTGRDAVRQMLAPRSRRERDNDYSRYWEGWRWRTLSRMFFSRWCMGRLGRDRSCFRYAEGEVARRVLGRMRHALTVLDPSRNPYLGWILTGAHPNALPYSLRPGNFEPIRANLDRLELRCQDVRTAAETLPRGSIDAFNLSDVFEYMSPEVYSRTLGALVRAGRHGSRLAYWNVLVPRSRPDTLAGRLRPLRDLAERLHHNDGGFFYSAFVVEEVS